MSIRKSDYIAKYGEEAYEKEKEKRRIAHLNYCRNNRERIRAVSKAYRDNNIEIIRARDRERWKQEKGKRKITNKKRYEEKRETILAQKKEYYILNKENKLAYAKTKVGRANNLISAYNSKDIIKGRGKGNLTSSFIVNRIFTSSCIYCGDNNWKHLGCDRIDDALPHNEDNCVCACGICNIERASKKMSVEEFIEYRRTHPRDEEPKRLQEIVEVNGKKVIRKAGI